MKKDSIIDCLSCILFKTLGALIRNLPKGCGLFLGARLGDFFYYSAARRRALAYSHIKAALGANLSPRQLKRVTRQFYQRLIQNIFEIFFIPLVDKRYLQKYISFRGLENIAAGFKRGKGIILLAVHEGNWELYNTICANLGFPFSLFVRGQERYRRLEKLLDSYRLKNGCRLIQRETQLRQLIQALKRNEAVGMTVDQGGKSGEIIDFFGRQAAMATGALRLAMKYGAAIIPAFFFRVGGPYLKIIILPPFEIKRSGERSKDIRENLQEITRIFEELIAAHPQEYFWLYKIWKYGKEKNILILSDGKAGHLRQAQAAAKAASSCLKERGISAEIYTQQVRFKSRLSKCALALSGLFSGKYSCQGCLWCLRASLEGGVYRLLAAAKPDIIISCGGSLTSVNYLLARENLATSIVVMRPPLLGIRRFDLAVIPRHDRPPKRKNIVLSDGALNLIDEEYLKEQAGRLIESAGCGLTAPGSYIGALIGGDARRFRLRNEDILEVIRQIKQAAERLGADILVTTSRRTPPRIENIIDNEFGGYPRCKLLVIANKKNIPEAVGGILGLSRVVVSSPESISMISEAASSRRYVVVFRSEGLSSKHRRFLEHSARNKYIYLAEKPDLGRRIEGVWLDKPPISSMQDNVLIRQALEDIL